MESFWVLTGTLLPKSQLYADVVRCFRGICSLLYPKMGPGTRVCGNRHSHGKPCQSQYLYKIASAMPADSSKNLQLSQRNDGPEPATIARDRSLLACVVSVSNRVIARKLERKLKKVEGGGGGEKRIPCHSFFFALVPAF